MIEVYKNNSDYIGLSVYISGVPTDAATGSVTATLIDTTTGLTLDTQPGERDAIGHYRYLIPLAYTQSDRTLKVVWNFLIGAQAATRTEYVEVVTPYISVDEIKSSYPQLASKTYNEIRDMERRVRAIINVVTGQSFGSKTETISFYGEGQDKLQLNRRITKITGFTANGISPYLAADLPFKLVNDGWGFIVNPSTGFNVNSYYNYDIKSDIGYSYNSLPGNYERSGFFSRGILYTITANFGWDYVPSDINLATKLLIGDYFCTQDAWRLRGVKATSAADMTFEFFDHQGTGNADVDRMLGVYASPNLVII